MSNFKSDFEVIRTIGEPALLEHLAEECAELAQAAFEAGAVEARGETTKETPGEKKKTRQSEFLKMFPNSVKIYGIPDFCPRLMDFKYMPAVGCENIACYVCKKDFWLAEVE